MIIHPRSRHEVWFRNAWIRGVLVEVPCLPCPFQLGGGTVLIVMKLYLFYFSFQDEGNVF